MARYLQIYLSNDNDNESSNSNISQLNSDLNFLINLLANEHNNSEHEHENGNGNGNKLRSFLDENVTLEMYGDNDDIYTDVPTSRITMNSFCDKPSIVKELMYIYDDGNTPNNSPPLSVQTRNLTHDTWNCSICRNLQNLGFNRLGLPSPMFYSNFLSSTANNHHFRSSTSSTLISSPTTTIPPILPTRTPRSPIISPPNLNGVFSNGVFSDGVFSDDYRVVFQPLSSYQNRSLGYMNQNDIKEIVGQYKFVTNKDTELLQKECYVCQQQFEVKKAYRKLLCNHYFHKRCIDQWIKRRNLTCPTCRTSLSQSS